MFSTRMMLFAAALVLLFANPTLAQQRPGDAELAQALRAGGHVIVIRHGETNNDMSNPASLKNDSMVQQRQLNARGEAAARALGGAFKAMGIPVGPVYTSRFDRAYQTAVLAGFANAEKTIDVTEGGPEVSANENNRRAAAFRKLAGTLPPAGSNIVVVSHKPNIIDAFGKDWLDIKEGEASIFKPDGNGYVLIARVQMDEWTRIAAAKK